MALLELRLERTVEEGEELRKTDFEIAAFEDFVSHGTKGKAYVKGESLVGLGRLPGYSTAPSCILPTWHSGRRLMALTNGISLIQFQHVMVSPVYGCIYGRIIAQSGLACRDLKQCHIIVLHRYTVLISHY